MKKKVLRIKKQNIKFIGRKILNKNIEYQFYLIMTDELLNDQVILNEYKKR